MGENVESNLNIDIVGKFLATRSVVEFMSLLNPHEVQNINHQPITIREFGSTSVMPDKGTKWKAEAANSEDEASTNRQKECYTNKDKGEVATLKPPSDP